jgi:ABC-type transporter Mla MlaB component
MATNEKHNLIGYDPLAWMDEPDIAALAEVGDAANAIEIEDFDQQEPTEIQEDLDLADLADDDQLTDLSDITDDYAAEEDFSVQENLEEEAVSDETSIENLASVDEAATGSPFIQLEGNLSIQHIGGLFETFKASLSSNDQIDIDASAVSSIDTATLQLLVALKKAADKQEKQITISQPSAKFIESVKLLGLLEALNID